MSSDITSHTKRAGWAGLALLGFGVVAVLCLSARFASHHSAAQLFVFVSLCVVVLADFLFVKDAVDKGRLGLSTLAKLMCISVVAGVLLEGLTVLGSPASHFMNLADWSKRRAAIFIAASFIATQPVWLRARAGGERSSSVRGLKGSSSRLFPFVVFVVIVAFVVVFRIGTQYPFVFYALGVIALCGAVLLFIRKTISLSAVFFLLSFISGSLMMYGLPVTTGLSWDDQIHYENAAASSYVTQSQLTDTERMFAVEAIERAQGKPAPSVENLDPNAIEEHVAYLNQSYGEDVAVGRVLIDKTNQSIFEINRIGYVPSAIGLWLGRLVHLSFSSQVMFAKLCNLLSYSFVIAAAIAVTPSKKGLFVFVGLLPTSVWQASNFSYDPWLISFVMLGFAYYLRYAWGQKEDFNRKNIALAFLLTFAGLAVKAIYFPVIGLFFLVPKERFSNASQRRRYNAAVFFLGLFTFASFALPYLAAPGAAAGDARGGSDVNSGKQISFILSNPLGYAAILTKYLFGTYFSPFNSAGYALTFAYVGDLPRLMSDGVIKELVSVTPATALFLVGVTANDEACARHAGVGASLWALFLTLFTFVLVATALYVSFTPVGLETVNGCQFRYILPMLVPALGIIFNNNYFTFGGKRTWQTCCLCVSLLFFAACLAGLILARFV